MFSGKVPPPKSGRFILAQRHHSMGSNRVNDCLYENAGRPFEGTIPPSQGLFHHSVHGDRTVEPRTPPKGRSFPWVSLPLLVIAEQTTLCVACSIACQRYHTPDCPHLRPNKDGLDAHWWLFTAQIGQINGKKRVEGRFRSPWICCGEGAPHGRKMKLGL